MPVEASFQKRFVPSHVPVTGTAVLAAAPLRSQESVAEWAAGTARRAAMVPSKMAGREGRFMLLLVVAESVAKAGRTLGKFIDATNGGVNSFCAVREAAELFGKKEAMADSLARPASLARP